MAWCLADPEIGEREVAAGLLDLGRDTGALRDGMIVLADEGLAGREMERYAADQVKVLLARPDQQIFLLSLSRPRSRSIGDGLSRHLSAAPSVRPDSP